MSQITMTTPDDWHCHLREGVYLSTTVPATAKHFGRAIVMPNLKSPITTAQQAQRYRQEILNTLEKDTRFTPLMTLYLTDHTTPAIIEEAKTSGVVTACKLYPAHVTTHSAAGVTQLSALYPTLEAMAQVDMPLLIHGEVNDPHVDIFDRERIFIESHLTPLLRRLPQLRIVFEHISTQEAVDFVTSAPHTVAATITPHHLYCHRNALFVGGMRPHYYCLPILKRRADQEALIRAATSGNPKFFIGTDSAPHAQHQKESDCGCAGIYNTNTALSVYAQVFEAVGALSRLEGFTSHYGADFYRLPRHEGTLTLLKQPWTVPSTVAFGQTTAIPFLAGETLDWQVLTSPH